MSKSNVVEFEGRGSFSDALTDLLKSGAQQLLCQAVEAELSTFLVQFEERRLDDGRAAVVRNGHLPERETQTGIVRSPSKCQRYAHETVSRLRSARALVPPFVRKSTSLEAALPWLYLKGISSGEMQSALEVLVGADAKGLSASTISRLKQQWETEYLAWKEAPLDKD